MKNLKDLVNPHILGIQTYQPGKPIEEVQRELGLEKVFKLASNESCVGPSPLAISAIQEMLPRAHFYPDSSWYYPRNKLAERLGVSPNEILFGAGAVEILYFIAIVFLKPGDEVLAGAPSFAMYPIVTQMMGATFTPVPLRNYRLHPVDMLSYVSPATKLIFLDNPNNPCGTVFTDAEFCEFMENLREDVIVVADEAYADFVTIPDFPRSLEWVKRGRYVIILRTFSKNYGLAGIRIGYALSSREIIQLLEKVVPPFNVSSLAQAAVLAALDDKEHLERTVRITLEEKKFLYEVFHSLGLSFVPSEANYILVELPGDARSFFQLLLKEGVIVRPVG
ncbi:MAG: histidinol-phosphate transaminase, partial [bacterium]